MTEVEIRSGLIKTKYTKPGANPYLISRERLIRKLDHSLKRKVTLITAPAGYGKTTAVVEWLEKRRLLAAWVSLDAVDNNPTEFWRYCCAALDGIAAGLSRSVDFVFAAPELTSANIHLNILIDWLTDRKDDFLFILDDIHRITNPAIIKGLSYLINYLPPKMHVVLIGREEPRLELAKHGITSQLLRIDFQDLCFQSEEIARFYHIRGFSLTNTELQKVENNTEGWGAALVAIAMSLEESGGRDIFRGPLIKCKNDINQYLKDEVLNFWPEEKQDFAMKISILDVLCGPLCDAVTGDANADRLLQEISERNGFLTPLDEDNREYAFHPLFKEFLYRQLLERNSQLLPVLHKQAASWYLENGISSKAIEHFLDYGAYREAVSLIEEQINYWGPRKEFTRLLSWIVRLPEDYQRRSFLICAEYALYYAEMNRFDLAREWIGRMDSLAATEKYTANRELNNRSQTVICLIKANQLMKEGKIRDLPSYIKAAAIANTDGYYKMVGYLDLNTTDIYFYRCTNHEVVELFGANPESYRKMVADYRRMISINPGYAPLAAGEYLYENNRLEEAFPYLLEGLEEARAADCPGAFVPVMINIARLRKAWGDLQGAQTALDECNRSLQCGTRIHWRSMVEAFRCRLFLDSAAFEQAEQWLNACKLDIFMEISRVREYELLVYARVLMAKERWRDAELLLTRLQTFAAGTDRPHSLVEVLNLLAMVAYQNNDQSGAALCLEKSLWLGSEKGYIRSYIDEGAPMADLLARFLKLRRKERNETDSAPLIAFVKELHKQIAENLRTYPLAGRETAAAGEKKLLTGQERKVLALLLEGDTNQEIGRKLGIGLSTVKCHTGNIYGKLGVKNRLQCVKLAREAGLLE